MKKIFKCSSLILILMLLFSLKIVKASGNYVIPAKDVYNLIDNKNLPAEYSKTEKKMCLKFVNKLWKKASSTTPWPTKPFCCAYNHSLEYGISGTAKNGKLVTYPPIGAYVYYKDVDGGATSHNGHKCGHVAIYVGTINGKKRQVIHAFGEEVRYHDIENIPGYQLTSWGYPMGIEVERIPDDGFDLNINLTSYPKEITAGSSSSLQGKITSGHNITNISAKILNSSSKTISYVSTAPNTLNVDIGNSVINKNLKFSSLPASDKPYTLVITAKDDSNKKEVQISKTFTVKNPLSINLTSYPTKLTAGSGYGLRGAITSIYKIDKISAKILNGSKVMASTEGRTNSYSINIKDSIINNNIKFGSLPVSTTPYTLVITAHDTNGNTMTISKNFTVTKAVIDINLTSTLSTLTKGKSFGLRGEITSSNPIKKVRGYIKTKTGIIKCESTDTPNTLSMNIRYSNLNNDLKFKKLPVGSYVLVISVLDNKGKLESKTYNFDVK